MKSIVSNYFWYSIILTSIFIGSCKSDDFQFELINPKHSNVVFNNIITENDSMNILDYEYLYNGGGVGIGDFNNDGYEDIFFSGNMVDNKLYLNKGDFVFEDVTKDSGTEVSDKWSSGVAVVDINGDGWKDIYICHNTLEDSIARENTLLINKGLNDQGIPVFDDMANAYGLDDNSYSVNSAFFDYDNDGDLDVIVIINEMQETRFPSKYIAKKKKKTNYQRVDKLFRNDMDPDKGHPVFTDVSEEAGINIPGFSLGVNITDINQDGWKDIYITNDFLSNDILYINQKNGSFVDESKKYFKHTSFSAMGNDVVDINNDGLSDIIALDMLPEGNYRQKKLLGPNNYTSYINNERYGFTFQVVRNTVQLNNGMKAGNDEISFSDVSLYSGLSATDWSWTPLVADFDHDQYRDVIVTNGFPKDVTDMDFIDYKADNYTFAPKSMMLSKIPSIKSKNCAFKNNGDLTFSNVTDDWGMEQSSYSNGAAYADLDNDGDLDVVINNIDDFAFIYRNRTIEKKSPKHYLKIKLKGKDLNPDAIGSTIQIELDSTTIYYEHTPFRGYLSTHSSIIHLGLGDVSVIPRLLITWPDNSYHSLTNVQTDQLVEISYDQNNSSDRAISSVPTQEIFKSRKDFDHKHIDHDFIDYNIQPLLPHKLSQYGPSLSVVDINADGLEDVYVSGSAFEKGYFLMQGPEGQFVVDTFQSNNPKMEEQGILFFDADIDGDNDMVIVSGSYEFNLDDPITQDRFFENVEGTLEFRENALPEFYSSGSCVKAADYDRDGDLDLFVGGRVIPGDYPLPTTSYLLENVTSEGTIQFKISNDEDLPDLNEIGLTSDALWTDFNNDGWVDLIVMLEFSPIQFFQNNNGKLTRLTDTGVDNLKGFWNSITGSDIDKDGDIDYILGNQGKNMYYEISEEYPYQIYVKDFDNNGSMDALPFVYAKDIDGTKKQFPFMSRIDFAKEINVTRKMYPSYESYARADLPTIITDSTRAITDVYEVNYLPTSIAYNLGNGRFEIVALPAESQLAPVYGTIASDFTGDGINDILLIGNDYGNEIFFGRLNALNGLLLKGGENRNFVPVKVQESGFYVPGDGKSLIYIHGNDKTYVIGGENNAQIRLFEIERSGRLFTPLWSDRKLTITTPEKTYIEEVYYGNGFFSQSTRKINIPENATSVIVENFNGETREVLNEIQ